MKMEVQSTKVTVNELAELTDKLRIGKRKAAKAEPDSVPKISIRSKAIKKSDKKCKKSQK